MPAGLMVGLWPGEPLAGVGAEGICRCQQNIPGRNTERLPTPPRRDPAPSHAGMLPPHSDNNRLHRGSLIHPGILFF